MSFKDIKNTIESSYYSARLHVDLVNDFYVPVLSNASRYDRISGYFTSTSLAIAARGISKFIEHGGHMRLICGCQLTPKDKDAIINADSLKDFVNETFLNDYRSLEEGFKKDHVKLLGWMIANNFLEIKIAFNLLNPTRSIDDLVHSKTGILYDENGDMIYFNGSVNETASGWGSNIETIDVLNSWKYPELIEPHIEDFEASWEGRFPAMLVMDVPNDSIQEMINDAPSDEKELKKLLNKFDKKSKDPRTPRNYQLVAVSNWLENGKTGILEMATGTGKTYTAKLCIENVLNEENALVVISCPYLHLIEQWKNELSSFDDCEFFEFHSDGDKDWRRTFSDLITKINLGVNLKKRPIILTIQDTFHTPEFTKNIYKCEIKKLLVVDEVHHVGSLTYSEGLKPPYDYYLGLSATPERYMDPEGTQRLLHYFKKIVFRFTLAQALILRDEKGNPFLTNYYYHPIKVNISDEEHKNKSSANNTEKKYQILEEIIDSLEKPIDHLIIFCSSFQLESVLKILNDKGIKRKSRFTYKENRDMRKKLLTEFDEGTLKALVAIRCLNEGVDVPSTDKVIIMSSSPNPAENVQRRGRVLRRHKGKEKAYIYDMIVIPEEDSKLEHFKETELDRLVEFISSSDNKRENRELLIEWGLINE